MTCGTHSHYHISTDEELSVNDVVRAILEAVGKPFDDSTVRYVTNRAGQDVRYALDCNRLRGLGWRPRHRFADTLPRLVAYYEGLLRRDSRREAVA